MKRKESKKKQLKAVKSQPKKIDTVRKIDISDLKCLLDYMNNLGILKTMAYENENTKNVYIITRVK